MVLGLLGISCLCPLGRAEAQSLWADRAGTGRGIFADRKACAVGDIVTIVISESTTLSTAKNTDNSKKGSTSVNAGVGIFDFLKAASASGSDSFKADGSSTAKNTTTANVTVTVVDIQPNGNLVLEGTQSIWHNKNEHKITFRGVCRPEDVTASNTIPSTKIAAAEVKFNGKGPLNAKQRQGILTQVFNILF
jgi:flagellar L-ring protein precursor FlgH